jgi:two-component system, OmpR family, catabolic regulation response regulator CreB
MADRIHILIVEDDPFIVDVIVASLESEYRVSSVDTVGTALAFLRTSHVDIVLVDTGLPDGRGTEVACFASTLGAAVIEMSGYPQVIDNLERSERLYLLKPFGVQALLSAIKDALHKAQ